MLLKYKDVILENNYQQIPYAIVSAPSPRTKIIKIMKNKINLFIDKYPYGSAFLFALIALPFVWLFITSFLIVMQ